MASPNTIKFSQFAAMSYSNTTNMLVGTNASSGGNNVITPFPPSWTTATRPTLPATGILGFNTNLNQYEYWNGAAWIQLAAGGSGTVNVGAANQLAYYAANGSAVSGLMSGNNSVLTTNNSGVPSLNTTLPSGLTIPQPVIQGITAGSSAASGVVGEVISSVIAFGSSISLSNGVAANVTSIVVPAGDFDLFGNIWVNGSAAVITSTTIGINSISGVFADKSLTAGIGNVLVSFDARTAPSYPITSASPQTFYLVVNATFASGTVTACGAIYARRRR